MTNTVETLEGEERGIPNVADSGQSNGTNKKVIGIIVFIIPVIVLLVALYMNGFLSSSEQHDSNDENTVHKEAQTNTTKIPTRTFKLAPEATPTALPTPTFTPIPDATPPPRANASKNTVNSNAVITKSRRGMLLSSNAGSSSASEASSPSAPYQDENDARLREARHSLAQANAADSEDGALGGMLNPTETSTNYASILRDRDYLITKGTFFHCVLYTKIITSVAGKTKCVTTRNIYSDNGKVLLLERGSEIDGEYRQGLQQGQGRIFVLWDRIKTPMGVVINLLSPGTGSLGEGGIGGYIDNHFWKRYGGATMLSLIDDLGNALSDNNGSNGLGNTSGAATDAATEALSNSINIPPTLYKNQGELVAVYLARDLNFRSVYDVAPQ